MLVHGEQREPDVICLRNGAAGAMLIDVANLEILVGAAGILADAAGGDFLAAGHVVFLRSRATNSRKSLWCTAARRSLPLFACSAVVLAEDRLAQSGLARLGRKAGGRP